MRLAVEAPATLSTEDLTLLVFKDGVQSVSWEEEDMTSNGQANGVATRGSDPLAAFRLPSA